MPFMLISELIPTNLEKSKIAVLLMQEIQIAKYLILIFFCFETVTHSRKLSKVKLWKREREKEVPGIC